MIWSPKHPASVENFFFDYSTQLGDGDSLLASPLDVVAVRLPERTTAPAELVLGLPALWDDDPTHVTTLISGGRDETTYELTSTAETANGETLVIVAVLIVRAKPR